MPRNALNYYMVIWFDPSWNRETCKTFATKRAAVSWTRRLGSLAWRIDYGCASRGFVGVSSSPYRGREVSHAA